VVFGVGRSGTADVCNIESSGSAKPGPKTEAKYRIQGGEISKENTRRQPHTASLQNTAPRNAVYVFGETAGFSAWTGKYQVKIKVEDVES
jgi:hypothetical protein